MTKKIIFLTFLVIFGFFFIAGNSRYAMNVNSPDYDVLIKNGRVFDGSLKPAFKADVAVKDGRIVKVARSIKGSASTIIDAKGLHVGPGFIDLHSHVGIGMYFPENRACLNYLTQGVTTVTAGHCGYSAWPIVEKAKDQIERWSKDGIGPNLALFIGHGSVREIVMGKENREPAPEELEKMKALVKEAMEEGAHGLSTGLIYVPGTFAKTDEVIELVKVIKPYSGIYHTHIRNETEKLLEAVEEAIEICQKTCVPIHISHFKVWRGARKGGEVIKMACQLIEEARAKGLTITADQYPFPFSAYIYRNIILPKTWLGNTDNQSLGNDDVIKIFDKLRDSELIDFYEKITPYYPISEHHRAYLDTLPRKQLVSRVASMFLEMFDYNSVENPRLRTLFFRRMQDPEKAEKIREEIRKGIERVAVSPEHFIVAMCVEKELEGKTLKQVAAIKNKSVEDAAIELDLMGAKCVPLMMSEEDIEYIMQKDYVGTGSDGEAIFYGIGQSHIRSYTTFLHKIREYALKRKVVTVEHVIRSQTSLPAQIMNWKDRGWIKQGYKADIVVLDLQNIKTEATISNPHQYCKGVEYLVINGEVAIEKGKWNGRLPGNVIRLSR